MSFPDYNKSFVSAVLIALATGMAALSSAASAQNSTTLNGNSAAIAGPGASYWQKPEPTGRLIVKYHSAEQQAWQPPRGSKRFVRSALRDSHKMGLSRHLSAVRELVTPENTGKNPTRDDMQQLRNQARALSAESQIEYASIEYRRFPLLEPNDSLYRGSARPGNQSYLYEGEYSLQAPGAWDITTGSSDSVIAIVDTGILPGHPDIQDRSVDGLGYDFVSADNPNDYFSANDGDGRDPDPTDPGDPCNGGSSSWHGTGVASAAAGSSNNGEGLAGIDWNARLLHARALGICGGTDADIIDAIRWSAGLPVTGVPVNPNPANVVNLSLGGATECTRAWQDVIDELTAQNIVFVMAAGNESRNALRSSPANCANVITVGSSTSNGRVDSAFSNFGLKVTVTTGGRNIVVASNTGFDAADPEGDFYRAEIGTSFSAALVSGGISLMQSLNPDLGPAGVRAILQESATPYAAGTDCDTYYCGGGVLNLSRAMSFLRDGNYDPDRDISVDLIENQSTAIPLQQNSNAALSGFKDIRYFSIDAPQQGLLQIESNSDNDLYGYLLNSDLSVIAMDDDSGTDLDFRVASLVDAGRYYVAVERESHRVNDGELPFTLSTSLSDNAPDPFIFAPVTDAVANGVVESNTVTITGLQGESVLTVSDGFYSVNNGDLINTPTTISNGDTIVVVTRSPGSPLGNTVATITVGAYSTAFSVTTAAEENGDGNIELASAMSGSGSGCSISRVATVDPLLLLLLLATCAALFTRRSKTT